MKLSDTQLIILSSAAQRDDGLATLPEKLKGGAAKAAVTKLLTLGLVKEVRVKRDQPSWRMDDEEKPLGLKITKAGSAAIQVGDEGAEPDEPAQRKASAKQPGRGGEPRTGSKQAQVIALMQRKAGATLDDMVAATGWLPHTTRAALTGLRKKGLRAREGEERQRQDRLPHREGGCGLMPRLTKEQVEAEIATLDGLSLEALRERWRTLYGNPAPRSLRSWPPEGKGKLRRVSNEDAKLVRIERQLAAKATKQKARARRRPAAGAQVDMGFPERRRP